MKHTIIGRDTFLKGDFHPSGEAVIAGRVEGTIVSQDRLEIAVDGVVEGDIHGVLVDIQGTVKGNVVATRACRMGATARVTGELRAANLSVAEGASLSGMAHFGGAAQPAVQTPVVPERAFEFQTPQLTVARGGMMNRIESLTAQIDQLATATLTGVLDTPTPSDSAVHVVPQAVQQTIHRAPKIIKAR